MLRGIQGLDMMVPKSHCVSAFPAFSACASLARCCKAGLSNFCLNGPMRAIPLACRGAGRAYSLKAYFQSLCKQPDHSVVDCCLLRDASGLESCLAASVPSLQFLWEISAPRHHHVDCSWLRYSQTCDVAATTREGNERQRRCGLQGRHHHWCDTVPAPHPCRP